MLSRVEGRRSWLLGWALLLGAPRRDSRSVVTFKVDRSTTWIGPEVSLLCETWWLFPDRNQP